MERLARGLLSISARGNMRLKGSDNREGIGGLHQGQKNTALGTRGRLESYFCFWIKVILVVAYLHPPSLRRDEGGTGFGCPHPNE